MTSFATAPSAPTSITPPPGRERRRGRALRVAIVTESFLPSVNGVARSVAQVAGHLDRRGHEVLVIAPRPGDAVHQDVPVRRLPSVPLPFCREFPVGLPTPALRAALTAFEPDVVHLASPIVLGARGATLARDLGLPSVAIYQTDVAGFATQFGMTRASTPVWRWLRRIHNAADRTLAPSRSAIADLRRHGITEVHRWGRGVDTVAFAPTHRRRPRTEEVAKVRVGYVGRLSVEKRVDRLAPLVGLPGTELVVVGDGNDRARLEHLLPTARFTGQLTGEALSQAYADLDVFVHTGTHETFCQAAQEALASGVPVVAPAAGGLLDLVRHGRNGLFWDPADEASLPPAVARLVAAPQLRAWQGRAARAGVADRTWEAIGDQLLDHYLDVLGRDRTGRIAA
jgi:phosphatidylinositol alpha 1,6-mannosyltransferase